jgi:DtxR family Mn-dependent transcriptional regulator
MQKNNQEDYIGAIYRLRAGADEPLPLNQLQAYFGFSPISIHEMVKKLDHDGLIVYLPYKGVRLSEKGEEAASNLIRRHRIWERFLADVLKVSWGESHEIAHELEHAAPDWVTEKLANLLGNPDSCPHGDQIPSVDRPGSEPEVCQLQYAGKYQISKISPEIPAFLEQLEELDLVPGKEIEVELISPEGVTIKKGTEKFQLSADIIKTIWIKSN